VSELLARVRALIRRGNRQARPTIDLADVKIDLVARNVTRAGAEVILTAREYAVLEYLAMRRGEIVTRTALYDHLFGEEDSTLSNVIDVHVSNLRRKLGADVIATRRGHGYVIA
jgi:two-component system OmpR family response regulator